MNTFCGRLIKPCKGLGLPTQAGFSVVEIMISLVLGLLVTAGVSQIYLGSKQSYRLNEAQSRLQEDGRFAVEYLARNIRLAGFKTSPVADDNLNSFPAENIFSNNQVVAGVSGDGNATSDSISVRFQRLDNETPIDCLGSSVNPGVRAVNTFYVDMENDELECAAANPADESSPSQQPVISNFGNLSILYGEVNDSQKDFNFRADRSVDHYVVANNVTSWLRVVSVRIEFQLRSAEDNLAPAPTTYSFNGINYTDRRLRRTFELTVSLRNILP